MRNKFDVLKFLHLALALLPAPAKTKFPALAGKVYVMFLKTFSKVLLKYNNNNINEVASNEYVGAGTNGNSF